LTRNVLPCPRLPGEQNQAFFVYLPEDKRRHSSKGNE
jgi:hypothetical protein